MAEAAKLMAGKRGIVFGVANNRSIAWGITKACRDQGAEIALTYQGDAIKKRVEPLAAEIGSKLVLPCDVTDEGSVEAVFKALANSWGTIDFLVHAVAFSDKGSLTGAMSTRARTISPRRSSSPATPSPRSPSAPRN